MKNSSNKKAKYSIRKTSLGVVSAMVGTVIGLSPMTVSDVEAAEGEDVETGQATEEVVETQTEGTEEVKAPVQEEVGNESEDPAEEEAPVQEATALEDSAVEGEEPTEEEVANEEPAQAVEGQDEPAEVEEAEEIAPLQTATPEAPIVRAPVSPDANIVSIEAEPNTTVRLTFPDGTEVEQATNRWGLTNIQVPENVTYSVGDTLTLVAINADDVESETYNYMVPDPLAETQLTVNPVLPEEHHEGISGTATPGAIVTISYPGNAGTRSDIADENGNWSIDTTGLSARFTSGAEGTISVALDGVVHRNVDTYTVEEAPTIELPRPEGPRNERLPHGTMIYAEEFVTNSEEFPEGTTFEFYDYDTDAGSESFYLDVSPNPEFRNQRLVIRATHPDAEDYADSSSFTVIVEALEAPEVHDLATRKSDRVEGVTPENAEEIRVYLPGDSEDYREARILSARPGTNTRSFTFALPEGYEWEAGDEVRVTAVDADGNESEATVQTVLNSDELTQLTVDPISSGAEVLSGTVNPAAESVQVVLPGGAQISANVADDGTWSAQTLGNASSLTAGEAVDVRVRIDDNTHTYEDEFFVRGAVDVEDSNLVIGRLGYYNDRYYQATITLVDEFGNPVEGLTEEDFNIDTFGGIVNFSADGNEYKLDTESADELRPDHSLSVEDGVVTVNIADEREAPVDLENSSHRLSRLGFYGDRYYQNVITVVDELGRPVEGLTEEDFNIDTFGGIVIFEADGNEYTLDTEVAGELRPDHSLTVDENGVIQINISDEREAPIDLENSSHILARLGYYGDRYYRNTITVVDELGRPVEGLTEEDFNIDTFGGIVNFEADGNEYILDTEEAGELRPNHSLSVDDNGVIQINIVDEREAPVDLENSSHILARLGFYGDRYYRNTITLVDELGRNVEGLTQDDFNVLGYGGIENFEVNGNEYILDTAYAGDLRPDYTLSMVDDAITIDIEEPAEEVEEAEVTVQPVVEGDETITITGTPGAEVGILIEEANSPAIQLFSVGETYIATIGEDGEYVYNPEDYVATAGDVITVTWTGGDGSVLAEYTVEAAEVEEPTDPEDPEDERLAEFEERMAEMEEALQRLEEQNAAFLEELAALQAELEEANAATAALEERVAALEAQLAELEDEADDQEQGDSEEPSDEDDSTDSVAGEEESTDPVADEEAPEADDANEESELESEENTDHSDAIVDPDSEKDAEDEALPKTGVAGSSIGLGIAAILSGLGLSIFGKKKEDEE